MKKKFIIPNVSVTPMEAAQMICNSTISIGGTEVHGVAGAKSTTSNATVQINFDL